MSREAFVSHWTQNHPRFVWALPGVRRYVQNPSIAGSREWQFDGVAELWFDDKKAVAKAFSCAAAEPMRNDEKVFLDDITWFLVEELEVPRPDEPTPTKEASP